MKPSRKEIAAFLRANPNPDDSTFHNFAKSKGWNVHAAEAVAYELATSAVRSGLEGLGASPAFQTLVDRALVAGVTEIPPEEVKSRLGTGAFTLLDVREPAEWRTGHIPTAVHLPRGVIERDVEQLLPDKDASVVAYCAKGKRSALATQSLQQMGYTQAKSMAGGYEAWVARGFSTVSPRRRWIWAGVGLALLIGTVIVVRRYP